MIRAATPADAEAVAAVYAPYVHSSVASFEEVPPTGQEMARRMATGLPWLVADLGGVVGYAYAGPHHVRPAYRWSVDVSVYVAASHSRQGVGRALYGELLPLLRQLGYVNAYAGVTLPNAASVALHESVGFTPVGVYRRVGFKLGAWHDVGWWELALTERPESPAPPRTWEQV